jgi:hypothetical protein
MRAPQQASAGWTSRVGRFILPLFPEPIELYRFRHEYSPKASKHALTLWTLVVYSLAVATFALLLRKQWVEARGKLIYEVTTARKTGWECVSITGYTGVLDAGRDPIPGNISLVMGTLNRVAGITPEGCRQYLTSNDPCAQGLKTLADPGDSVQAPYNVTQVMC